MIMKTIKRIGIVGLVLGLAAATAEAKVDVYFNSDKAENLDDRILSVLAAAEAKAASGRMATIDVMVFSFTTRRLADEMLRIAQAYPRLVTVRLVTDLSQISHSQQHMSAYFEDVAAAKYSNACTIVCQGKANCKTPCADELKARFASQKLDNVSVRYKWYPEAYVWDAKLKRATLDHGRSRLMHHKVAIVNGDTMVAGTYNWTPAALKSNYENLMVFSGARERRLIRRYLAEFEALWQSNDLTKSGTDARRLRAEIFNRIRLANQ
jgi:phosphatidylserine/phosphatidylglycerophosphate/cardiolipin synthase-like enzyme